MKKRFLAFIVLVSVLCTAFPVFADEPEQPITGSCGQYLRYEYYQSTRTLTIIGNGNMPNYPADKYEGSIAPWRNDGRIDNYLEKVVISNGVTSVGENAFFWCDKITSVTIPSSVESIGAGAFYSCKALTSVNIPDGVESIGEDAFKYCDGLKEVTFPSSVKSIGEGAFSNCYYEETDDDYKITYSRGLEKVIIQYGVETIGVQAFYMCKKLNTIELPDSVKSIGHWAFYDTGCYNDWEDSDDDVLYIGNHLISAYQGKSTLCNIKSETKTIADSAFFACGDLPNITIPDTVVSIGKHAFEKCNSLKSITIPKSVTSIGDRAFLNCSKLTGITIPDGVMKIGESTFYNCWRLTSITIPNSVLIIDKDAFKECTNLQQVYYIGSETDWGKVIGNGKYDLTGIGITHISGISARRSENGNIVVKPINIAAGKSVILALYDGDKFVEMQQSNEYSETNREITFIPTKPYTCAKVMIWNSLSGMSPVCDFKIVK